MNALQQDVAMVSTVNRHHTRFTRSTPAKRFKVAVALQQTRLHHLCVEYDANRKPMADFLKGVGHCKRLFM
jgi:hypothetical protein